MRILLIITEALLVEPINGLSFFVFVKGTLDDKDKIKSVDREYVMLFTVFDENQSWYIDENIKTYLTAKNPGPLDQLKATFDFWESNLKGTINGYMFGNLPMPKMYIGEQVAWYLLQVGGNTEMHTVHFHGQSILYVSIYSEQNTANPAIIIPSNFVSKGTVRKI